MDSSLPESFSLLSRVDFLLLRTRCLLFSIESFLKATKPFMFGTTSSLLAIAAELFAIDPRSRAIRSGYRPQRGRRDSGSFGISLSSDRLSSQPEAEKTYRDC